MRKTTSVTAKTNRKPVRKVAPPREVAPLDPTRILVRELMRTEVLTLRPDDSLHAAAEQLEDARVSGAPVVDAAGNLLGVLTLTDIARSEHVSADEGVVTRRMRQPAPYDDLEAEGGEDEELFPTDDYETGVLGKLRVADWMTPHVVHVEPEASVAAAARVMLDEAIHRVFVVDGQRLLGVVSTEDFVRLLAAPASPARARR